MYTDSSSSSSSSSPADYTIFVESSRSFLDKIQILKRLVRAVLLLCPGGSLRRGLECNKVPYNSCTTAPAAVKQTPTYNKERKRENIVKSLINHFTTAAAAETQTTTTTQNDDDVCCCASVYERDGCASH